MRALLVTSAVTFVPENYDDFVLPMAEIPEVIGLLVIDNRSWKILFQGLLLLITGAAPRMGWQIIKNHFGNSLERKRRAFEAQGKSFRIVSDINAAETLHLLQEMQLDLLVNARTRSLFKKPLLQIPKLGCINIHHGLLPHQRGLMCDFWAHFFATSSGFSIHQMTPKLDDGALLKVVEVPSDKKDYLASLKKGAGLEALTLKDLLKQIALQGSLSSIENKKTDETVYRRNPRLRDFYRLRFKGIKI